MAPQDHLFIEPANADEYEVVYGDYNETMGSEYQGSGAIGRPYIRLNSLLKNQTKKTGQTARLKCEAAGSPLPIRFSWFKNHAPLEREKNIKRKNRDYWSRIIISELDVHDKGYYKCVATNAAGSVETTGILQVELSDNQRPSVPEFDHDSDSSLAGPSLNGAWPDAVSSQKFESGACREYGGDVCKQYLSGQMVLITSTKVEEILDIERHLTAAMMFISNRTDISDDCKRYSHMVACYHKYHICAPNGAMEKSPSKTLAICPSHCELLQNEKCPNEYKQAEEHKLIGPGPNQLLPDCSQLPKTRHCIAVLDNQSPDTSQVNPQHFCYVASGKSYRGTADRTESGRPCMNWNRAGERLSSANYPELSKAKNYCRNPDGRPKPWCYGAPNGQEEFCDLNTCPEGMFPHLRRQEELLTKSDNKNDHKNTKTDSNGTFDHLDRFWTSLTPHWQYALIGGVCALLLLLFLVICCCCCRKRDKKRPTNIQKTNGSINGSLLNSTTANGQYYRKMNGSSLSSQNHTAALELSSLLPPPPSSPPPAIADIPPEMPPEQIKLIEPLGEGQFGKVWKGELIGYTTANGEPMQVAVKTLKEEALPRQRNDFQQEIHYTAMLRHPNIVELLGVCLRTQPQCAIFEYMIHGDLHEFLLLRSPYSLPPGESGLDRERVMIDHNDFLHIATQIAAGMEYLANMHYVHRDLASRNCLVTDRLTIKIADFGLMRDVYKSDYYRMQSKSLLPIRWMPPEAIVYGKFAETSDIWAYGVTLWEIYSYGTQPYFGYRNEEVVELIRTRALLECPENCPPRMYSLMVECWHEAAGRRPRFSELHGRLQTWSVLSSPAQSSALSTHHLSSLQCGPARPGSVNSAATSSTAPQGRASRQSSQLSVGPTIPHIQQNGLRNSPFNPPNSSTPQTLLPLNGMVSYQKMQHQGSPSLKSRGGNDCSPSMPHRPRTGSNSYKLYNGDADSSS